MKPMELAALIKCRQTQKVLAPVEQPIMYPADVVERCDSNVKTAIAAAGWAPFHYDRAVDEIAEPWRVYVLNQGRCRTLAAEFSALFKDVKSSNKLPSMLSACGCLVLVTWLPQFLFNATDPDSGVAREKQLQIDEEHLAATSAFVQNLLLMLTAEGLGTYWSSGGQFRTTKMFDHLQIPLSERLLAAVFVDYQPENSTVERLNGKLRNRRASVNQWTRWS